MTRFTQCVIHSGIINDYSLVRRKLRNKFNKGNTHVKITDIILIILYHRTPTKKLNRYDSCVGKGFLNSIKCFSCYVLIRRNHFSFLHILIIPQCRVSEMKGQQFSLFFTLFVNVLIPRVFYGKSLDSRFSLLKKRVCDAL